MCSPRGHAGIAATCHGLSMTGGGSFTSPENFQLLGSGRCQCVGPSKHSESGLHATRLEKQHDMCCMRCSRKCSKTDLPASGSTAEGMRHLPLRDVRLSIAAVSGFWVQKVREARVGRPLSECLSIAGPCGLHESATVQECLKSWPWRISLRASWKVTTILQSHSRP